MNSGLWRVVLSALFLAAGGCSLGEGVVDVGDTASVTVGPAPDGTNDNDNENTSVTNANENAHGDDNPTVNENENENGNPGAGPPPPLRLIADPGVDGQSASVGAAVPVSPRVTLLDADDRPVPGVSVTFTPSDGGSVSSPTVLTDASGQAASGAWTLGTRAGAQSLTVAAAGAELMIGASAVVGSAASLEFGASVQGQRAGVGRSVALDPFAVAEDAFGNPVSGLTVAFAVTSGGGSVAFDSVTTDADGVASAGEWLLGPDPGLNALEASGGGLVANLEASAIAPELVVVGGDLQSASPGELLPESLVVEVSSEGQPVVGLPVLFEIARGDGALLRDGVSQGSTTEVVTDAAGRAEVEGVMGTALGLVVVEASVAGGVAVELWAASTEFDIELEILTPLSATDAAAFRMAEFLWEATIVNDLPNLSGNGCLTGDPVQVDDVQIEVQVEFIDGPFNRLGSAGPCSARGPAVASLSPLTGEMSFDSADTARLAQDGTLVTTILHEMGHVLGIGTLWGVKHLIENPSTDGTPCTNETPGQDTRFLGAAANTEWVSLGGSGNAPVENDTDTFGCGSLDSHFREAAFGDELMTPDLGSAGRLSRVTVASLDDLGVYNVRYDVTEPYALPTGGGLVDVQGPRNAACGARQVVPVGVRDDVVIMGPRPRD